MAENKDERGSVKIPLELHREIGQFAAGQGLGNGEVVENAWQEYKENHGIVIPKIEFHVSKKSKVARGA